MPNTITKDLGPVSGYAIAVENGYTGTEEEWIAEVLRGTQNAQTATEKAAEAAASERVAAESADDASDSADSAKADALKAEGYAVGKQNDVDVVDGPYYHNNAKYYAEQAEASKRAAASSETAAGTAAAAAQEWATGQDDTTAEPGPENNAAYYAAQAAAQAEAAAGSAASGIAALANEAQTFDATKAYSAGAYVLYNSVLYRFTADHAAGAWTGTDATAVKIGEEFGDLKSALSEVVVITDRPTSFDLVDGEYVNVSGVFTPYTGWSRTDYIDIGGLTSVKFESTARERSQYNFWYDSSKAPIGSRWNVNIGETTQIVPQNAKYMVLSGKTANMQKTAAYIGDKDTALVGTLPLTDAMKSEVEEMVGGDSADSYGLSSDALLYVDKVPTYYIDPASNPATYADAKPYLERKIAEIPSGKSMLFICDTHWPGNQKHSTQLMNFVRKRTGIENVLFGGDVYGNAASKFAAVKIMGQYLYQSRQAFGDKYIPTVGDHDNNTVNVSVIADAYVPYAQVAELFIGDIKRRYTCYQPSEKVAGMATGDTYNEIMEFFKTVYYVDDEKTQTRIIVLNCGNGGNYGALYDVFGTTGVELLRLQIPFLISSLYSTQENWNVCILSHKIEYGGAAPSAIQLLLSAFKTKRSYIKPSPAASGNTNIEAFWPYNTQYDFSGAPTLGFMYCLCGHTHTDVIKWSGYTEAGGSISRGNDYSGETLEQSTLGQIPYITTATDASANTEADGPTMTNGTVTEQCFDAITLVDDGLVFTRFGAGDNRRIYITA